jgi:hypothetical protein
MGEKCEGCRGHSGRKKLNYKEIDIRKQNDDKH